MLHNAILYSNQIGTNGLGSTPAPHRRCQPGKPLSRCCSLSQDFTNLQVRHFTRYLRHLRIFSSAKWCQACLYYLILAWFGLLVTFGNGHMATFWASAAFEAGCGDDLATCWQHIDRVQHGDASDIDPETLSLQSKSIQKSSKIQTDTRTNLRNVPPPRQTRFNAPDVQVANSSGRFRHEDLHSQSHPSPSTTCSFCLNSFVILKSEPFPSVLPKLWKTDNANRFISFTKAHSA